MPIDKHALGWADYTYKLEKQNAMLLKTCKAVYKDYQRVMSGRGAPSIMAMNKVEAAIAQVEDN